MLASVSFFQAAPPCFISQIVPLAALDNSHSVPMAFAGLNEGEKKRGREK